MEKKLLLLGLLLSQEMHGYELVELLKQNPSPPISLKKSNVYKLLSDMERDGWITHTEEQDGNRPTRRVYSVTETGQSVFNRLLRDNLAVHVAPEFPSIVGYDFLSLLPTHEIISLLSERLEMVRSKYQELAQISEEIRQAHRSIQYLYQFYAKEIEWLSDLIAYLQE